MGSRFPWAFHPLVREIGCPDQSPNLPSTIFAEWRGVPVSFEAPAHSEGPLRSPAVRVESTNRACVHLTERDRESNTEAPSDFEGGHH